MKVRGENHSQASYIACTSSVTASPSVGYDAEHCNGVDTLGRLFAGEDHHCLHDVGKCLSHRLCHTTTRNVTHSRPTLDDRPAQGGKIASELLSLSFKYLLPAVVSYPTETRR